MHHCKSVFLFVIGVRRGEVEIRFERTRLRTQKFEFVRKEANRDLERVIRGTRYGRALPPRL